MLAGITGKSKFQRLHAGHSKTPKNINRKSRERAFTLIEMLIAVCIMGALAAIAIPMYTKYVAKARQADAKTQLIAIQQGQEIYKLQHGAYAAHEERAGISGWMDTVGRYSFSITAADGGAFTAVASGDIDGDGTPDVWTINQEGRLVNGPSDL